MSKISTSYADLLYKLARAYTRSTPAAALFYWDDNHTHGLRIESIEIMKEFVNNVDFGRDPEGLLFYNAVSDFDASEDVTYKVYYNSEKNKAIQIDFYSGGDTSSTFASFLAQDDAGIQTDVLQNGSGEWRNLKTGTSCAEISKISNQKKVTMKMAPIGKKVTFDANNVTSDNLPIKGQGVFYFPKLTDLSGTDCVVNYNEDRIIFYPSTDKGKLVAVFFPTAGTTLGINNDHNFNPPTAKFENL